MRFFPVIRRDSLWIIRWHVLRYFLDLSYASICKEFHRQISVPSSARRVLDIGAGLAPWRRYFHGRQYLTVDPHTPADFRSLSELPQGYQADLILCLEVLEHVADPVTFLVESKSYLRAGGELWISVPFQARVHGCPEDYQRWTPAGLEKLLSESGWQILELRARGGDWSLLASKWIFFWGRRLSSPLTFLPAAILFLVSAPVVSLLGHLSMRLGWGFSDEAMGWFVRAQVKS
ncbi:MAG: methyltransferase domain-containing protein [Bdellovibrionales bacterium]|nr:methyltransferase domain-containing protein [Bdellovibrionales bacterium]